MCCAVSCTTAGLGWRLARCEGLWWTDAEWDHDSVGSLLLCVVTTKPTAVSGDMCSPNHEKLCGCVAEVETSSRVVVVFVASGALRWLEQ